jgi:hypothetical protein
VIASEPPKEIKVVPEEERQADYYKGFRTAVVLVWVFCNLALGAVVLNAAGLSRMGSDEKDKQSDEKRAMIYMAVILWSVVAISSIKFIGAMWYLVVRMVSGQSQFPVRVSQLTISSSAVFDRFSWLWAFVLYTFVDLYGMMTSHDRLLHWLGLSVCLLYIYHCCISSLVYTREGLNRSESILRLHADAYPR